MKSVVIDIGDKRWAEEPVGKDTLARYDRVDGVPPYRMNGEKFMTLWRLKTTEGRND